MSDWIEVDGKKYFEEGYLVLANQRATIVRQERDEARAKLTACIEFMVTEMHWEEFRAEILYHDDVKKQNTSEENARKLRNFLVRIKA